MLFLIGVFKTLNRKIEVVSSIYIIMEVGRFTEWLMIKIGIIVN